MLTNYDVVWDGRIRKQARSLAAAGAAVTVIGYGTDDCGALTNEPHQSILLERPQAGRSWWQHHRIPRIVRVLISRMRTLADNWCSLYAPSWWADKNQVDENLVVQVLKCEPDVLHLYNPSVVPTARRVMKTWAGPVVYDAGELFENYFPRSGWGVQRQRAADWAERYMSTVAAAVTTVSPSIAHVLRERFARQDVEVVLNSLHAEDFTAQEVRRPVRLLNQAGFRTTTHDHLMVEAMVHLRGLATLTMQGWFMSPAYEQQVRDFIAEHDLGDTVFLEGSYSPLECIQLASNHDVGVAVYRADTRSKDLTLANRFFTYLGAGLALAMPDVAAHRDFPEYEEFGILLDTSSAETIAESLRPLLEDPARIDRMKKAALGAYERYSWEQQERVLIGVYERVLAEVADRD